MKDEGGSSTEPEVQWIFRFPEDEKQAKLQALGGTALSTSSQIACTPLEAEDVGGAGAADAAAPPQLPFVVGDKVDISKEPEGPYNLFSATVVDVLPASREVIVAPYIVGHTGSG